VLLDLNNVLVTSRELPDLFRGIVTTLQRVILMITQAWRCLIDDRAAEDLRARLSGTSGFFKPESVVPTRLSPGRPRDCARADIGGQRAELDEYQSEIVRQLRAREYRRSVVFRDEPGADVCTLNLATGARTGLAPRHRIVQQVAAQIAIAVETRWQFKEIDVLKDKLAVEKLYLEEEIRTEFNFEEIIGESAPLKRALAQVELVAPAGRRC